MDNLYMIRDTNTGLYCRGGLDARFSKAGKIWRHEGALKCFLTNWGVCHTNTRRAAAKVPRVPTSWEILVINIEQGLTRKYSANELHKRPAKR